MISQELSPQVQGFFDARTHTWSYVVWAPGHGDRRCAILDSVLDYESACARVTTTHADNLLAFVKEQNLTPQWILETHVHADHLSACAYLKEKTGAQVAISTRVRDVLKMWQPLFQNAQDTPLTGAQFDVLLEDEETFAIGPLTARVLATPGHTPADVSYLIGDAVFVGDLLFLPDVGTGRCDFPGGSADASYDSVQKILSLPSPTRIFVGHDYPPRGKRRVPACQTTVHETRSNIRLQGVSKEAYVTQRKKDDHAKAPPDLLLPALQVNLRAGSLGESAQGVHFLKIPLNQI